MTTFISHQAEQLSALLSERLGVHAGVGFAEKLAKAGRRLPRWARRDGALIVTAMQWETHPMLSRQIDHDRVARAVKNLTRHLGGLDASKRRKNKILDLIASIAFVVCVTVGLILGIMIWRDLI